MFSLCNIAYEREGDKFNMTYNIVRRFSTEASRISSTILITMLLCSAVLLPSMIQNAKATASPGVGYFIIVAGRLYEGDHRQGAIDGGCCKLYRVLLDIGFTKDRIYFLCSTDRDCDGDGVSDVNAYSSSTNLQNAIETWAAPKVGPFEPLFLYLFDHGGGPPCCGAERFCINVGDTLSPTTLNGWLDTLEDEEYTHVHVIYAACHSGSFINELSRGGRIIASSCRPEQHSYVSSDWNWEAFSQPFWKQVQSGHSVAWSFNYACDEVKEIHPDQVPLLDDNWDEVGHTGPLPSGGDGYLAYTVYIGSRWSWVFPWIAYVISMVTRTWPPISSITLWAKVETKAPLLSVTAWMIPPDWSPPSPGETELIDMPYEPFPMTDSDHDGNWTVDIPAVNFTNHATGPSDFKFIISAEDEDGNPAISRMTRVVFFDYEDTTPPRVHIERPIEGRRISGTIHINGIAIDDACLDSVELYINDDYKQTIDLPPTSNSFFNFSFGTTGMGAIRSITVKAFDKKGNWGTQAIVVTVPVGGIWVIVDKFGLLAPYIALAIAVAAVALGAVSARKRWFGKAVLPKP